MQREEAPIKKAACGEGVMVSPAIQYEVTCRMCESDKVRLANPLADTEFYQCVNCAFIYCPRPSERRVNPRYEHTQPNNTGASVSGWADSTFLDPAIEELARMGPSFTALDFGTRQSPVPDILRRQGHRVIAVDIVPPKEEHEDRLTGDLLDLCLPSNSFDLAYSFQVFEHLPAPRPILLELLRLVRDQGLVLIHTEMGSFGKDMLGFEKGRYKRSPGLYSYYRHKTFDVALADLPHEVEYISDNTILIRKRATRDQLN